MFANFTKVIFRRLRLVKFNRNLLVFLVFLAVSIAFWFMQSLQETTEVSIDYALKIEEVPKNVIFTSDVPEVVTVNYTSKGWTACYHKFLKNEPRELTVKFKDINHPATGKVIIDATLLRRAVAKLDTKDMTYTSTSPSKIEAFYSKGRRKRVPIMLGGRVNTAPGRYLCSTALVPDSVYLYAPDRLLDSIRSIQTEDITHEALEDTLVTRLALKAPHGVKLMTDSVTVKLNIDIFTDKTLQVPIYCDNVPKNKIIRLFPLNANVTFLVSSTHYSDIKPNDFIIVVDYQETATNPKWCKLHVSQKPDEVRNLRISPEYVEYVIEKATE